jgi:hypothetical protein
VLATPAVYQSTQFPTFKEWSMAMQKLPTYHALAAQGVLNGDFNIAANYKDSVFSKSTNLAAGPYDFTELSNILQAYFNLENTGLLSRASNWVGHKLPSASFFDPKQIYFDADNSVSFISFVQKLNLPAGSKVILRGDIHGDGISLVNQIANLQKQGYMDKHDGFKLADKNSYMLFLGDYTDRGLYGAETIYTILRLKLANPDQVFMAHGNHEDIVSNQAEGFIAELNAKFGALDFTPVYRMYEYLPAAIYLGCGTNYWQCCHGGLEIGYNPAKLLNYSTAIAFDLIEELQQVSFLKKHDATIGKYFKFADPACDCAPDESCDTCAVSTANTSANNTNRTDNLSSNDIDMRKKFYPNVFANFIPTSPLGFTGQVIGFMWNDFEVFDQSPDPKLSTSDYMRQQFKQNPSSAEVKSWGLKGMDGIYGSKEAFLGRLKNGRMFFSKQLTKAVLAAQNSKQSYNIRGIIRAHQHDTSTKILMMGGLVKNNGIFGLWSSQDQTGTTRKLSDYAVLTLCVAPDNIFGVSCKYNWDTFGILDLDQDHTKCVLTIEHTTVSTVAPVIPTKPAKVKVKSGKAKS